MYCICGVKVDDSAMNSYSHPLAGASGKRSTRNDSSGMLNRYFYGVAEQTMICATTGLSVTSHSIC